MERGDLFVLAAPREVRGHEQRGKRYAVILQADEFLPRSTVIAAPTSTSAPEASFRPEIWIDKARTRVLVDQLSAFDLGRFGQWAGQLSRRELDEIDLALRNVLDLR